MIACFKPDFLIRLWLQDEVSIATHGGGHDGVTLQSFQAIGNNRLNGCGVQLAVDQF
jgi:hypothetical protein